MTGRPWQSGGRVTLLLGDARDQLAQLPAASADCVVTSPPYYQLRDYGAPGQYGLEDTPDAYIAHLRAVFGEAHRVLAANGTLWLNLGDCYVSGPTGPRRSSGLGGRPNVATTPHGSGGKDGGGLPAKWLLGMPWRVAFALQADGWLLRSCVIWHKPNAMPDSVRDRPAAKHEHLLQVRNAVDGATAAQLTSAFRDFDADPEAAVAVLFGAGGKFCSGADLSSIGTPAGNSAACPSGSP